MQQVNSAIAAGTWPVAYNTGSLFTWGDNSAGQLGLSNTTNYSSPKQVGSNYWINVGLIESASGAVRSDGTLWT